MVYPGEYRNSHFFLIEGTLFLELLQSRNRPNAKSNNVQKATTSWCMQKYSKFYPVTEKKKLQMYQLSFYSHFLVVWVDYVAVFIFATLACLRCNIKTDAVSHTYNSLPESGKMAKFNGRFIHLRIVEFKI